MNSLQQFTIKKNINMLWDVLLDELNIDIENKTITTNIRSIFEGNINPFLSHANPASGLMNLNKLFLSQVLTAINRLFPNLKQDQEQQQMKLISIGDETTDEPYKVEDIHNARQTDFEKQVNQRRNEFDNLVNVKKPKEVDFTDKTENSKIREMEALIAETVAKRNFDIEQIQSNMSSNSNSNSEEWLKSNDTSEKQKPIVDNNNNNQRKHKYLNIEPTSLSPKKVSFDENRNMTLTIEELTDQIEIPNNIFSKLKKIEPTVTTVNPVQSQINEMNTKIDKLFAMMEQMSSNIQHIMEVQN
jgi:hypothetical protein